MKFVHAADLHLDSPLLGLERYDGAPVHRLRNATREAFEALVDLCLEEEVELLLLAGDLYDGGWKDYSTGLFFARQMSRLRLAEVPVVWIRGNHDAASQVMRHLELPDNVRELPFRKPGSVELRLRDHDVVVHGQGFESRDVSDNLVAGYPAAVAGAFNVGLLHTALTGRPGHDRYAPCSVEELVAKGYDYWALGHVHQREVLCEAPFIVFPGNLQGRHARETGPKGASIVTVESSRVTRVEHRPLDVVRWVHCEVDVSSARSADDALELYRERLRKESEGADGRLLAMRVVLAGVTPAHAALVQDHERWIGQIREIATDEALDEVWVEKIRIATRDGLSLEELARHDDAVGEVFRGLEELRGDDEALRALFADLGELLSKLPSALREGPEPLELESDAARRVLLDDVEQMLLPRLLGEEP